MNSLAASLTGLGQLGQITADSVPDQPNDWGTTEWITWHKRLEERYGLDLANEKWLVAFNAQPWYDWDKNFMQYNCTSLKYFASKGIPSSAVARLSCGIEDVVGGAGDVLSNVGDSASDLSKGAATTASVLKNMVPVLLIALAAGGGYYIYKNYIKGNKQLPLGIDLRLK